MVTWTAHDYQFMRKVSNDLTSHTSCSTHAVVGDVFLHLSIVLRGTYFYPSAGVGLLTNV
jgi:hypothetical protein